MFYQTFALCVVLIMGSCTFCTCQMFIYSVLIDAGSSGCKLEVYQITLNEQGKVTWPQDIKSVQHNRRKVKPGLSSFADNLSGIKDYLKKVIDGAKKVVPVEAYATTPVLLMATAGMRVLTKQQQQSVMAEVRTVLKDKAISPFRFKDENARIISGVYEGVYGWLTVNFLNGAFSKIDSKTYGTLELGGASAQVSYHPFHRHVTESVKIAGMLYRLYAKSYLGYGMGDVRHRFNEYVGKMISGNGNGDFTSPCHHRGFETNLQIGGKQVHLIGAANFRKCAKIMDSLFFCANKSQPCPFKNEPPLTKTFQDFYAFSVFYNVLNGIGALHDSPTITVDYLRRATEKFCLKNYNDVNSRPFAKDDCIGAVYIHELLTKGYKANKKFKMTVVSTINVSEERLSSMACCDDVINTDLILSESNNVYSSSSSSSSS